METVYFYRANEAATGSRIIGDLQATLQLFADRWREDEDAIAANVFVVLFSLIAIVICIWDYYRITAEDVQGSIEATGGFHGAVSGQAGGAGTDEVSQSVFEGVNGDG